MMCPCCSGKPFEECCKPYLNGALALTAEALMRSRYTAYATNDTDYIKKTMTKKWQSSAPLMWIDLEIIEATENVVEFKAKYIHNGKKVVLHERSNFIKKDGAWLYTGGDHYS